MWFVVGDQRALSHRIVPAPEDGDRARLPIALVHEEPNWGFSSAAIPTEASSRGPRRPPPPHSPAAKRGTVRAPSITPEAPSDLVEAGLATLTETVLPRGRERQGWKVALCSAGLDLAPLVVHRDPDDLGDRCGFVAVQSLRGLVAL